MPYAKEFVPRLSNAKFPNPITELYNPKMLSSDYIQLLTECEKVFEEIKVIHNRNRKLAIMDMHYNFQITKDEITVVEKETRGQSSKKSWFTFRSGRLTASLIRCATKTSHAMPSQSLIKRMCYPELYTFSTKATRSVN